MEVDESINNDESQQRNVYGSLIDPEEHENSEGCEVGDKSTCKLSFIVEFIVGTFASDGIFQMNFILFYRLSFRTYLQNKYAVHVKVLVHAEQAEALVRAKQPRKPAHQVAFAIKTK